MIRRTRSTGYLFMGQVGSDATVQDQKYISANNNRRNFFFWSLEWKDMNFQTILFLHFLFQLNFNDFFANLNVLWKFFYWYYFLMFKKIKVQMINNVDPITDNHKSILMSASNHQLLW